MGKLVRKYDVLLSCPSDVTEELTIIKDTIENFNLTIGNANDIILQTKHWETHSYTASGGAPQDLLNKQFVLDCDVVVAVFWSRFGSPTDEYDSGTEEEIEILLNKGKQVFLYFSNVPIPPSEHNAEEYKRIQEFKKGYSNRGLYSIYTNTEDFKGKFTNDLSLYFLNHIKNEQNDIESKKSPSISIKGISNDKATNEIQYVQFDLLNSSWILEKYKELKIIIKDIDQIELPRINKNNTALDNDKKISKETGQVAHLFEHQDKLATAYSRIFTERAVVISENDRKLINEFIKNKNIKIRNENFFEIGNLIETKNLISTGLPGYGPSYSYNGTDDEKKKYELIKSLIIKIREYNSWIEYFGNIDSKQLLMLAISNTGESFDEDVDIKLYIKKGYLVKKRTHPVPKEIILEQAKEQLNILYKIEQTHDIHRYPEVSIQTTKISSNYLSHTLGYGYQSSIDDLKNEFFNELDETFNYDYYENDHFDIISFNVRYIKQNTNIAFPSILLLNSKVGKIKYEINSKYSPEVIKGELLLNN